MRKLKAILALAAFVSIAACGGNGSRAQETTAAATPTATPTTTTATTLATPTAKATTLTREQAGAAYLRIIKPSNDLFLEPKCKQAEDFFVDGGEWPPKGNPEWPAPEKVLRGCYVRIVPLMTASNNALQTTPWPVDAREDMADLVSQDQAVLHCFRLGSRATSYTAMQKVFQCFPEDDGSADRVRARFGLPRRTP